MSNPEGLKIGDQYLIGKYLSEGAFGRIHCGKNIKTGENIAIKLEPKDMDKPQIPFEFSYYKKLGNKTKGIPKTYFSGTFNVWNVLVMELLGPTIYKVHENCGSKFSLKTTAQLALQLIEIYKYMHLKKFVYRDTKPENFLFGITGSDKYNVVHIIDLGLSKDLIDESTGQHIVMSDGKGMTGTVRYMSINNHMGRDQSRRDDLEALGYMLLFFIKGNLPWIGVKVESLTLRYLKIFEIKKSTKLEDLCNGLPEEFLSYMKYVRGLEFSAEPNYKFLIELFNKTLSKIGLKKDDTYDFDRSHKPIKKK